METIKNFIFDYWYLIGPGLLEIALRFFPTEKNRSIIDLLYKIISVSIPNRVSKDKITSITTPDGETKWLKKHIVHIIVFCLFSITSFAQVNYSAKSYRSYNADSLTVRTEVTGLQLMYGNVGAIYYNKQSSKWRVYEDSTWRDLLGSSGGGGAFWPLSGTGTLTAPVTIENDAHQLQIVSDDGGGNISGLSMSPGNYSIEAESSGAGGHIDVTTSSTDMDFDDGGTVKRLRITGTGSTFNGKVFLQSTATQSGLNLGSIATDPSALIPGDLFYDSGGDRIRARLSGSTITLNQGISNTAAQDEITKSASVGGNVIPTGIFSLTSGNMRLGSVSIAGDRTITAASSTAASSINLTTQGAGNLAINLSSTGRSQVGNAINRFDYIPSNNTFTLFKLTTAASTQVSITAAAGISGAVEGQDFLITGGAAFSTGNNDGGRVFIRDGAASNNGVGGGIELSGSPTATGTGGSISINTSSSTGAGNPGDILIETGGSTSTGTPGDITLLTGNAASGVAPGNISITTGVANGIAGNITIDAGTTTESAILTTQASQTQIFSGDPVGNHTLLEGDQNTISLVSRPGSGVDINFFEAFDTGLTIQTQTAASNITIEAVNGFIIINGLPANCTGVPTNGLANVAGVLTVCP